MGTSVRKKHLYIDAGPLAEPRMSGIGNVTLNIVKTLDRDPDFREVYEIHLIVAFNKTHYLARWKFSENIKIRKLYIPGKIMNGLVRFGMVPYMDLLFGRGVYLFPNFKNWPLCFSRSLTYVHDVAFKRYPDYIEAKNLHMLERNMQRWISRTDEVITVSEHAKEEITHFYPEAEGKVKVVHNGINLDDFYPRDDSEQNKVAEKYNLTPGKYFMFLSNIEPRKNVEKLLDAFEMFCHLNKPENVQLLLVGGMGWANEVIKNKIKNLQDRGIGVIQPGQYVPDEDIAPLLTGSIALLHPTIYEGFGISPLQAMACGKQVVVGRNSSIPEVVGDAGIYVDETSIDSIADGITQAFVRRNEMNKSGIVRAAEFSWSKSLLPLKNIILNVSLKK